MNAGHRFARLSGILLAPARRSFDLPAAILTGLAMASTYGGRDRFWAAWVGLVPALCAIYRSGYRRAFVVGSVAGIAQSFGMWHWLPPTTKAVLQSAWPGFLYLALTSLFYALFFGSLFLLIRCLVPQLSPSRGVFSRLRGIAAMACLWTGFEYGYAVLLMQTRQILTMSVGHSQWNHPSIIQLASLGGVYAVSFLIVAFNAAVADDLRRGRFAASAWVGGCVALCILGGRLRLHADNDGAGNGRSLSIAVLQGNIPSFREFSQESANFLAHRYLELGRAANRVHPDLIVWTEAAVPWPLREDDDLVTSMLHVTAPSHACHILGAVFPVAGASNAHYNSAFFIRPDGDVTAQYNKRRLLAFVETTVRIPFLSGTGLVPDADRKTIPGIRPPVMDSPVGRIGLMICNENLYPRAARECAALGAEFMVSPGNDFWFRDIPADDPIGGHFAAALFRAVETRRDFVVANNVGISAIIDSGGRILARSNRRTQACLSGRITRRIGQSFYTRAGDLFAWLCACIGVAALVSARHFGPGPGKAAEQNGKAAKRSGGQMLLNTVTAPSLYYLGSEPVPADKTN